MARKKTKQLGEAAMVSPGQLNIGKEFYDGCGMAEQNGKLLYDHWILVSTGNRIKER